MITFTVPWPLNVKPEFVYDLEMPPNAVSLKITVLEEVGQYMLPRGWPDMPSTSSTRAD